MSSPFLEVRHLSKHYRIEHSLFERLWRGSTRTIKAVDDVSFSIGRGQIMGLVGQSGCGKTTLARTMLRLCKATSGEVLFNGHDLLTVDATGLKSLRQQMQIMFQDSSTAIDPRYTARQCLEEPLLIHRFPEARRRERIEQALWWTRFPSSLLSRHPVELSGGQLQRLCLARALVLEPRFLVLDEPLAGLDPSVKAHVLSLLLELRDSLALSYLLISHDLETTLFACDRVAVMYRGRLVESFDPVDGPQSLVHPYSRRLFFPAEASCCLDHSSLQLFHDADNGSPVGTQSCVYAHDCEQATDDCFASEPDWHRVGDTHEVACYLA